jgi:hypothetical protein
VATTSANSVITLDHRLRAPATVQRAGVEGAAHVSFADREEVFEAGDAFYLPPGHIPVGNDPGSESVQFSPTAELRETQAVMRANIQALQPS